MSDLPPSDQSWSHATNSAEKFSVAIDDPVITAIEADIVMGRDLLAPEGHPIVPIMSHPPDFTSDLSAATFLDLVTKVESTSGGDGINEGRTLSKHIKLDFKDYDAVEPTLRIFKKLAAHGNGKTVYLNADILPGPGKTATDVTVPADEFVSTCLAHVVSEANVSCPRLRCSGHFFL